MIIIKMVNDIIQLCKIIEGFNKEDQIEILKIINNDNSNVISENNNGSFVNMEDLSNKTINDINYYVEYVLKKNIDIQTIEHKKDKLKNNINDITT
jgi:hypothetical protein